MAVNIKPKIRYRNGRAIRNPSAGAGAGAGDKDMAIAISATSGRLITK